MNFYTRFTRKDDSKSDPKHDPKNILIGRATVEVPSSQADLKDNDVKPSIEAASVLGMANGQKVHPKGETGRQANLTAVSDDKAGSEAMVSEGGNPSPGKTSGAIRDPDATGATQTEPRPDPTDASSDISVKSDI